MGREGMELVGIDGLVGCDEATSLGSGANGSSSW